MSSPTPFVFQTPTEYARTTPDIATVFAQATDRERAENTRACLLTGLASRTDLTAKHLRTIIKAMGRDQWHLLVTLFNNPVLRRTPKVHADLRHHISADAVPFLLTGLNNPVEYLPEIVLAADRHSMFPDLRDRVRAHFTPAQIDACMDGLVADYLSGDLGSRAPNVPSSTFLSSEHVDRLIAPAHDYFAVADETAAHTTAYVDHERTLERLVARTDLTEIQGHRIFDCIVVLNDVETACGFGYSRRIPRMLQGAGLPQSVLVRALCNPSICETLLDDDRFRLGVTAATVLEAIRQGAPASLLARYSVHEIPGDVMGLALNTVSDAISDLTEEHRQDVLDALLYGVLHRIGTPEWDLLYTTWLSPNPAAHSSAVDEFVAAVVQRAITWHDPSKVPVVEEFAAWASASTDPVLRRHAVEHAYDETQLVAATGDPSPLVRIMVLSHPDVTTRFVDLLSDDADAEVRRAVAAHPLAHVDTLRAMSADTDEQVRVIVAERFLSSFA